MEPVHRKLQAEGVPTVIVLDIRSVSRGARADTPFYWVPPQLRQAARVPLESSLLHFEQRRGPSPDWGLPAGIGRVYLYHVRKTGGTSLSRSFLSLGGEDPATVERRISASFLRRTASGTYVFAGGLRRSLESGRYFFGWSHIAAYQLRLPPDTFTLSVLRDPVQRALSYYNYLVAGDDATVVFAVKDEERRLAAGGFHAFLDRVPKQDLLCQLFMFSSGFNVDEALGRLTQCSLVLANERLNEGLSELNSRLELHLQPRRERVTSRKVEPPSPGELDRLRELLEPEYRLCAALGLTATGDAATGAGP
jgi:hypothetical protein